MEPFKVLLVDDNIEFRDRLRTYLQDQPNLEVIAQAKNGLEAITYTYVIQPNLVFIDASSPGTGVFEVAKWIKSFAPDTRIVFLSPRNGKPSETTFDIDGVDGYVCNGNLPQDIPALLERFRIEHESMSLSSL